MVIKLNRAFFARTPVEIHRVLELVASMAFQGLTEMECTMESQAVAGSLGSDVPAYAPKITCKNYLEEAYFAPLEAGCRASRLKPDLVFQEINFLEVRKAHGLFSLPPPFEGTKIMKIELAFNVLSHA